MPKFTVQFVSRRPGTFIIEAKDSDEAFDRAEKMELPEIEKTGTVEWDGDDVEIESVDVNEDDEVDENDDDGDNGEDDDEEG